jgi:hypothetical protein
MDCKKLWKYAILDGLGVYVYILLVAIFMSQANSWFGTEDIKILTPAIVLMLFVISALVTGSLVLGRPVMMYMDGMKKEAVRLVVQTAVVMAAILFINLTILYYAF